MKKIIIATIVGGLIVFIWSAIAHMLTPLGSMGLSILPNEAPVIEAMRTNIPNSGAYFFPGMKMDGTATPEEEKAWTEKLARGPSGLLMYYAEGSQPMMPSQLGLELLTVLLSTWVAAFVLARTTGAYLTRAIIVALFAVFAFLSLSLSLWIWYHFPFAFICAQMITEVIGYFLAGLAMAKIIPAAGA